MSNNYPFIPLDASRKEPLVKHLVDVCGIEPIPSDTINDLQEAILAFEENNGYERPVSLLPERLKPESPIVPATTANAEPRYTPIGAHPRREVIVQNSLSDSPQEYFQLNEYKCLVKFDEPVSLPEPMIRHIKDVRQTTYKQEKDGSITPLIRRCYAVSEA